MAAPRHHWNALVVEAAWNYRTCAQHGRRRWPIDRAIFGDLECQDAAEDEEELLDFVKRRQLGPLGSRRAMARPDACIRQVLGMWSHTGWKALSRGRSKKKKRVTGTIGNRAVDGRSAGAIFRDLEG